MRGSGLAALFLLLLLLLLTLAAALSSCSAMPPSVEWPRGSTVPEVNYNQLVLNVDSISAVTAINETGVLVLNVLDANGTAVRDATVFAFSSEEIRFDETKQWTDENGTVQFAFKALVAPYPGMSAVASAMMANHTDANILIPIVEKPYEPPLLEEVNLPHDSQDAENNAVMVVAGLVGVVAVGLYLYWNRGM